MLVRWCGCYNVAGVTWHTHLWKLWNMCSWTATEISFLLNCMWSICNARGFPISLSWCGNSVCDCTCVRACACVHKCVCMCACVRMGVLSWISLMIFLFFQIPFQLFHGNSSLPNAFTTTTGCVLLSLFYVMWVKMKLSHGRCIKQLAEVCSRWIEHLFREKI